MNYHLVAIAGENIKGASWRVDESGLLVGRETGCHIVLDDPLVSRRHCRLILDGGEVSLEDLGGRNPVLVNGVPCKQARLKAGDEIAIGRYQFVLASVARGGAGQDAESAAGETLSWEKGAPISMAVDSTRPPTVERPRTIQDLVLLYEISREFARANSTETLLATLRERLREHFNPLRLWIARTSADSLDFVSEDDAEPDPDPPLMAAIDKAIAGGKGILLPGKQRVDGQRALTLTLVCPVMASGRNLGALVLLTSPPHGAYDEEDLRFLVLLAQYLGPVMFVLENLEQLRRDNERLRALSGQSFEIIGESTAIAHVRSQVSKVAKSDLSVLLTGETGTGKELLARRIHVLSSRRDRPMVTINCAAIPRELFEGELFGYRKGAFTGADKDSPGLLVEADSGTLFLDEIGDLSLDNQSRILRLIENRTFRPLGAHAEAHVNIRFIVATNKDLDAAIRNGLFREDLYHRIRAFEITVPPLRKRPSDIPSLVSHFLELFKSQAKRPLSGIAPEAMAVLKSYPWPGNVRELRNTIERAILLARHEVIEAGDLALNLAPSNPNGEENLLSLAEAEKRHIAEVLRQCHGSVRQAAKILAIARTTLYAKVAEYGIDV